MTDRTARITSLDGLRGVAALVVLIHHASLVARPELDGTTWAWLTRSPLRLLVAGHEAVLVFFALSGIVVALPAMRPGFSWLRYYPARLLRLYLPVLAGLLLATALVLLVPRDPASMPEGSWMRNAQASDVTLASFLGEASLLRSSYDLDNVLWSLRWELFFSLLLPVFVRLALRRRHAVPLALLAALATVAGRLLDVDALVYLPVFLLGTLVGAHLDGIRALAAREPVRRRLPLLGALALLLLLAGGLGQSLAPGGSPVREGLTGLVGIGAALAVALGVVWPALRRRLDEHGAQWLGRISFSLYLVHAPVLGTIGYLVGPDRWWLTALVGVPLSLVVAAVFHRVVERPSHRLARTAGSASGRLGVRLARA